MTFGQEVLKIIISNGLFGLIVVGVTFFLNKRMEIFRAENSYIQKLAEARINAYEEIAELLGKIQFTIIVYDDIMKNKGKETDFYETAQLVQSKLGNFVNDYAALALKVLKYNMHIPSNTMDTLNGFLNFINPMADFFYNPTAETAKAVDTKKLFLAWKAVHDAVAQDVKTNPYKNKEFFKSI